MITGIESLSDAIGHLHREFDASFAAPPGGRSRDRESLIALRVGGETLAVRTQQITEVANCRRIVPVPTRVPGLLGITALRGILLPVYDLAALLGLPAAAGGSWLLLANRETPVGLVFDDFGGQTEIERACLYEGDSTGSRQYLRLTARVGAANRAVIDVPGLLEEIRRRAGVYETGKGVIQK